MLKALKNAFHSLSIRECFLIVAFVWAALAAAFNKTVKQYENTRAELASVRQDLQNQDTWLGQKATIDAQLQEALERVDSSKTFSQRKLIEKLTKIAQLIDSSVEDRSFDTKITRPKTRQNDLFDFHSVRVNIKRAALADLITYYDLIEQETPYLGIEQVQISVFPRDYRLLNATFIVASFEFEGDV